MYHDHPLRNLLLWALLLLSASRVHAAAAADPAGHWEGRIMLGKDGIVVTLDLAKNAAGAWIGSISVPISTSIDVPVTAIVVGGDTLEFAASLPGRALFKGGFSPDGSTITGTVSNAEGAVAFDLKRTGPAAVKVPPPSTPLPMEFAGTWEGAMETAKGTRLKLVLAAGADGTATGVLIPVDQPATEIPISTITVREKELTLELRAVSGSYRGTRGPGGEITGEWTQGATRVPLTFKRPATPASAPSRNR